jgi:hypothetical protein
MSGSAATTHRSIELLFSAGSASSVSDAELLERFRPGPPEVAEAAFEILLLRHGPMVLAGCRRIVGERHDPEDAFQAKFLIPRHPRGLNSLPAVGRKLAARRRPPRRVPAAFQD